VDDEVLAVDGNEAVVDDFATQRDETGQHLVEHLIRGQSISQ
jgi:uncharacterized protein (DUF39 family)